MSKLEINVEQLLAAKILSTDNQKSDIFTSGKIVLTQIDGVKYVYCKDCTNDSSGLKFCWKYDTSKGTGSQLYHLKNYHKEDHGKKTQIEVQKQQKITQHYIPKMNKNTVAYKRGLSSYGLMIANDMLPLQTSEKKGFQIFLQEICPGFELPSRKFISNNLMTTVEEVINSKKKKKIYQEMQVIQQINLTADVWSCRTNYSFLGLTSHFIDHEWIPRRGILDVIHVPESHTSVNLSLRLDECLEKLNKDNEVLIISAPEEISILEEETEDNAEDAQDEIFEETTTNDEFQEVDLNIQLTEFDEDLDTVEQDQSQSLLHVQAHDLSMPVVVTDSGANIVSACILSDVSRVSCLAHTINLVMKSINNIKQNQQMLQVAQAICKRYNTSPKRMERIRSLSVKVSFKKANVTRWWSAFDMVESVYVNRETIIQDLEQSINSDVKKTERTDARKIQLSINNSQRRMEQYLQLIEPIKSAIKKLEADKYPTMDKAFSTLIKLFCITQFKNNDSIYIQTMKTVLKQELGRRWEQLPKTLYFLGTILHPGLRNMNFLQQSDQQFFSFDRSQIQQILINNLKNLEQFQQHDEDVEIIQQPPKKQRRLSLLEEEEKFVTSKQLSQKLSQDDQILKEIQEYLEEAIDFDAEVLDYWKQNENVNKFPRITKLAKKIFSISCTSAPCERIFRFGTLVVTPTRNRLTPLTIQRLLTIKENFQLLNEMGYDVMGMIAQKLDLKNL